MSSTSNSSKNAQVDPYSSHEGYLTKEGGLVKSWKQRYFILKENRLSYFATKGDPESLKGVIDLTNAEITHSTTKTFPLVFQIYVIGGRTYYMYADSETSLREWIHALKKAQGRPEDEAERAIEAILSAKVEVNLDPHSSNNSSVSNFFKAAGSAVSSSVQGVATALKGPSSTPIFPATTPGGSNTSKNGGFAKPKSPTTPKAKSKEIRPTSTRSTKSTKSNKDSSSRLSSSAPASSSPISGGVDWYKPLHTDLPTSSSDTESKDKDKDKDKDKRMSTMSKASTVSKAGGSKRKAPSHTRSASSGSNKGKDKGKDKEKEKDKSKDKDKSARSPSPTKKAAKATKEGAKKAVGSMRKLVSKTFKGKNDKAGADSTAAYASKRSTVTTISTIPTSNTGSAVTTSAVDQKIRKGEVTSMFKTSTSTARFIDQDRVKEYTERERAPTIDPDDVKVPKVSGKEIKAEKKPKSFPKVGVTFNEPKK